MAYMKEFREVAVPLLREVLQNRSLPARLNATRVLHRFAQDGHEEVADELIKVLENKDEHDAVKHWAVLGLGEIFAYRTHKNLPVVQRGALAVLQFADARTKFDKAVVEQMTEPERDGIRYVRRAAIRALGNLRRPMIVDDAKAGARDGPTAELLVRILANGGADVSPTASLSEREEAAYALCKMQHRACPTYQPDYAAHQVVRLIAVLGAEAGRDDERARERWKYMASHLQEGLELLVADVDKTPNAAYVKKLAEESRRVLENLYDKDKSTGAISTLNEYVNTNPPKSTGVFGAPPAPKGQP
jgi:HEAT repeat protein